jgi:hypothetical protein
MAISLVIEEERGTCTGRYHPHNGYYAGDFTNRDASPAHTLEAEDAAVSAVTGALLVLPAADRAPNRASTPSPTRVLERTLASGSADAAA